MYVLCPHSLINMYSICAIYPLIGHAYTFVKIMPNKTMRSYLLEFASYIFIDMPSILPLHLINQHVVDLTYQLWCKSKLHTKVQRDAPKRHEQRQLITQQPRRKANSLCFLSTSNYICVLYHSTQHQLHIALQ